jgi:aryl-alcohol dehydrogenase-like predicted oxidoreductase
MAIIIQESGVMHYRRLGRTNLRVSEIGFGAWAIGGPTEVGAKPFGWGPVDEKEARAAIHRALDLGVNFFDTADVYGLGRSEEMLGQELRGREAYVATKAGNIRSEDGENRKDFSKDHLTRSVEKSLKQLKRETLDVFQLHNPTEEEIRRAECLEVLEQLRRSGKVRATGVSIHKPEEGLALLMGPNPPDTIQLVYNLLNTRMAKTVLPLALEEDVGIIARVPLQYGLLTGKYDRDTMFGEDDHRSWTLGQETVEAGVSLLERLGPRLQEHGLTPAQLALKFILAHPSVSVTIPGAKRPDQVEANTSVSDGKPLSSQLLRTIGEAQAESDR